MKRIACVYLITSVLFASCTKKSTYEKLVDGLVVHLNAKDNASHIKLQVMGDKIIHVTVAKADTFSTFKSLSVLDLKYKGPKWDLIESEDDVTLKTSEVQATVLLATGEVIFKDSTGN